MASHEGVEGGPADINTTGHSIQHLRAFPRCQALCTLITFNPPDTSLDGWRKPGGELIPVRSQEEAAGAGI